MQKIALDKPENSLYIELNHHSVEEAIMKNYLIALAALLAALQPACGQNYWILLEEYDAPGNYAHGLYYAGKLLWHVDWDTSSNISSIYKLNPYNMTVIDSFPSPVEQPWGITCDGSNFWLTTHGDWNGPTSLIVKIQQDTFAVDTTYAFDGYWFYGVTYDSVGRNLWIAAMSTGYVKYVLEFDGYNGQVVEWHPGLWGGEFATGMQYWDVQIWANTTNFLYPDHTYIVDIDDWEVSDVLIYSYVDADGIATNGLVWWISYWRFGNHIIQKVIPPGAVVHDIAAHSPIFPMPGTLQVLIFEPQARFINYGSCPENDVPFVCRIKETLTGNPAYYDSLVYNEVINPEEIVEITYCTAYLMPNLDYIVTFYSNLLWDQHRNNDTMRVYVHTEGIAHDLAILSVLEPGSTEPLALIYPTILVQNLGDVFEPIAPVHLQIEHPDGSLSEFDAQVYDLDVSEIDTIYFTPFNPLEQGEYVFTFDGMLPGDINPMNDLVVANCLVGLAHDVAPVEIVSPEGFEPLGPIEPEVIVENFGDFTENAFYTCCSVSDSTGQLYWEHVICPPLDPGDQFELSFPNFIPACPGYYTFTFATQLGGDNRPENDTLSTTSALGLVYDVSPIFVIDPSQILTPDPFQPAVIVSNLGNMTAGGFYTYCQVDRDSTVIYDLQIWMDTLEPGLTDTAVFQTIAFSGPGEYRFRFVTNWLLDNNPENDTLDVWASFPPHASSMDGPVVTEFRVEGGFPNPFNARTAFRIYLPQEADVRIDLYGLDGRKMHTYSFGWLRSGVHLATINAVGLPSGIYIARIQAGNWSHSTKIALLK